ncbi:MAG: DUF2693 domain-containing protein [Bacteroidetes bacterium]|uniref:DUF2693 domain-containing protein n=1 Tax=Candidatus Cryptobacteroides avicola TaxID=2840757 RepID=A0A940DWB5_9BACT|nr:DUF2693 domain-containing protein [Candidatus Cryptobacteroides avicola]
MEAIITMTNVDVHRAIVIAHRTEDMFLTGMLTSAIKTLKSELARRIVKITFLKKDGTLAVRYGTTIPALAGRHINGNGICADARNVVCFWDTEASGENKWRSFRYEKLISFE